MITQPEHNTYESGPPVPYRSPDAILRIDDNKLSDLVQDFFSDKTSATQRAYRKDLEDFAKFLKVDSVDDAAKAFLGHGQGTANWRALKYRQDLVSRKLAPATTNRRLASLRSLVNFSTQVGLVPWDLSVKSVKHQKYRDTFGPGKEVVLKMFAAVRDYPSPRKERDTVLLKLIYLLGLRRSEIAGLQLHDYDPGRKLLAVLGKGRSEKEILKISPGMIVSINEWIEKRGSEPGPLLNRLTVAGHTRNSMSPNGVYEIIKYIGRGIGVNVRPHGFRHTAITELCEEASKRGKTFKDVQDFARHKSPAVTLLYWDRAHSNQGEMSELLEEAIAV